MGWERRTGSWDHAIARLAERQHGVVARRQLSALGLSEREIDLRIATGYLHPVFRGAFAVGHLAIGRTARMLAAVLACGDGTVLSHGSAAELQSLWDRQPIPIDVIPPRRAGRKVADIRWHNVLQPTPAEIEIRKGIPCTTVSRTLVDMAGRTGFTALSRLVERAAIQRRLEVREVDRVLARGRRRGAPQLRAILDLWRTDTERRPRLRSPLEAHLLPALVAAGVPRPECNVKLGVDGGRPLEVDMLWRAEKLAIEADGEETHGTRRAFQEDRKRDQRLLAAGFRVARVTWRQAEDEPTAVAARIRRMLTSS
jgi:predicted transcriptional regulator of viral defense system